MIPLLLSAIAIASYLIGNINAVHIVSRIFRRQLPDFSGERAMAEINRVFGTPGIVAATVVDAAKTVVAVLLGGLVLHIAGGEPEGSLISYMAVGRCFAAFCVLLGHCWPVFHRFRGGRGGVVAMAAMFCVHFPLAVLIALIFAGVTWASKYMAVGTLTAAALSPLAVWIEYGGLCALLALFSVLVIFFTHRRSIVNLLRRREPKLNLQRDLSMKFEEEDF